MLVSSDALIGCPVRRLTLFAGCLQFIWSRSVDVPAPIEAVAVCDTIGSYGISTYNANLVHEAVALRAGRQQDVSGSPRSLRFCRAAGARSTAVRRWPRNRPSAVWRTRRA